MSGAATGVGAMSVASCATLDAAAPAQGVSFNVIYPNHAGARFDREYYKSTHVPMVMRVMKAVGVTLIEGVPRGETAAPFAMIAHFQFESAAALDAALARPEMADLRADLEKFTDIRPTTMFGRPL